MRILLVEDDPEQREPLYAALTRSGHIVDAVADGDTAQWLLTTQTYDLLILDWMLPGVDGIALCQQYRQARQAAPVLMLTAKDTTTDKVKGLDAGADDYLVKPVDLPELLARVRALRRRSPQWCGDRLEVGALILHLDTMQVEYCKQTLPLKSGDFQLLEYLMRHPRQILTHGQLEQALWTWDVPPESNAIAARIKRLRQKLRFLGLDEWIVTVYGTGYCLQPSTKSRE
ncbi:two-component system response regulator RppA [Oscillatoria salina]|uniref:two-component system response regulator RppA n=1 Tax=Oscillatoria salina TaxID=331517 RepID=UPI001CCB604B|nr:two-component system response regulator RppA [Oscillatoria salina]MBZ8181714.1 response regulator transcription factor [Oscillatoria salina IIICB1]